MNICDLKFSIFIHLTEWLATFHQEMVKETIILTAIVRLNIYCDVYFDRVALSDLVHLEDLSFTDSRYIIYRQSVCSHQTHKFRAASFWTIEIGTCEAVYERKFETGNN